MKNQGIDFDLINCSKIGFQFVEAIKELLIKLRFVFKTLFSSLFLTKEFNYGKQANAQSACRRR